MLDIKLMLNLLIRSAKLANARIEALIAERDAQHEAWQQAMLEYDKKCKEANKHCAHAEAAEADNARLRQRIQNQTDQINGLERSRRRLESLTAGADRRVDAVEADNVRLREAFAPVMAAAAKFSDEPVLADNMALFKAIANLRVEAVKARAALSIGKETK